MKLIVLLCLGFVSLSSASKILVVVPMPSRSHAILFEELISELVGKGHEIVYVSPYRLPKPVKNSKEIILEGMQEKLGMNSSQASSFMMKMPPILLIFLMPLMSHKLVESTMGYENFQQLLNSDEKFDLIIGELFIDEALLAGLSQKYNAPLVAVATSMPTVWANYLTDNPAPASYIPEMLLGYTSEMSLFQRVINMAASITNEFIHRFVHLPKQDKLLKKYFGEELPSVQEIMKNTSLILINHHNVLAYPRPLMPNMIEVGGYHVPKPKKLPEDLQKYMDESKEGVILFSMGSNVKSSAFPSETKSSILNAFSRLKQNVLWKFEDDTLKDIPKNVRISKWLPQSDILAHSNLKLFITHGGQLSTTEAVVRAIPVVGIPISADQHTNMALAEKLGFGKILNFNNINTDSLCETVNEILNNSRYKETAKKISKLLQDTPLSPMDTALFWIEYVIRNDGAPHFRSAAADLYWYQLYSIDVAVILVLISCLSWACTFYSCRFVYRKTCGRKCKKVSEDKKKN